MKRLLIAALLALSSTVFAATLNPIQLLNPAGSTAGQAIVSTGPSTPPGWTKVAATSGASFTGNIAFSYPTAATQLGVVWQNNGSTRWLFQNDGVAESGSNAGSNLVIGRFSDAGSFLSSPLSITRSTGLVTMPNGAAITGGSITSATSISTSNATISGGAISGVTLSGASITNSPISGAAGSFTTLGATGLINPTSSIGIKGTATNDSPAAGSIGESASNTTGPTSATTGTTLNATSVPLTAGNWMVQCSALFTPAASTVTSVIFVSVNTVSATNGGLGANTQLVASFVNGQQQTINSPWVNVKLASSGTVYCPSFASFSTSTMTISGAISAVRIR
jgi:hypothetical protein